MVVVGTGRGFKGMVKMRGRKKREGRGREEGQALIERGGSTCADH